MSFADKVEIEIKAGKGGDGRLSFRHEKFRAKGGPDGGDGGHGGSIIFEADHNLDTLSKYKTQRRVVAPDGQPGGQNRKKGKAGTDVVLKVPPGTLVKAEAEVLADLTASGQTAVIAKGGRGGFGNAHFTASTRQAPRLAELGEPGEARKLTLELKLVADVGLIGLPNAGKSTLLSVVTNAKPEIGDYPFTTLVPNLGIVDFENATFMVADIPGLIEGASKGKGLGDEFLRHIERTAVVIHLIDATSKDPVNDYQTVQRELADYAVDLTAKPQLVALTKIDALEPQALKAIQTRLAKQLPRGTNIFPISAVAHRDLAPLLRQVIKLVKVSRTQRQALEDELPVIDESTLPEAWRVVAEGPGRFTVSGQPIEGFALRTNWNSRDGIARLRDILRKTGVNRELVKSGAKAGDKIKIGDHELEWL